MVFRHSLAHYLTLALAVRWECFGVCWRVTQRGVLQGVPTASTGLTRQKPLSAATALARQL